MIKNLNLNDYNNILIIQTAFIGDTALALFFAADIKKINPNAKISFITTKVSAELLKQTKEIDNVIIFDKRNTNKGIKGLNKLASDINKKYNAFDIIFALHRSLRTTLLAHKIKANIKIGYNNSDLSILYNYRAKYIKHLHEINRNRQLFTPFKDIIFSGKTINRPNILFSKEDIEYINTILLNKINNNKTNIAAAIGSVWQTKRWNLNNFETVIKELTKNHNIFLIGSKSDAAECELLAQKTDAVSLAGKTTIPQTLYLLKNSKLLITNDSAPTHFASIVNIPTITIFGPTTPLFGFAPLADNSVSVEDNELFCHPCSIHGANKCPRKTLDCMKNITPDNILKIANNLLNK